MIPWYSVTYSDGQIEQVVISWKLVGVVLVGLYIFLWLIEKLAERLFK